MTLKPTAISLFCGCGGLDLGFVRAGFKICEAYDHWKPAVENHNKNINLLGGEAHLKSLSLKDDEIKIEEFPKVDLVLGGPPCQGFSFAGKQLIDDPRNFLYLDFKSIVEHVQPRVFLMENVRGLEKMALSEIQKSFQNIGYNVCVDRAAAIDLGIPQRRERVIIVGTRLNEKTFRTPSIFLGGLFGAQTPSSVLDAIRDLGEPVAAEEGEKIDAKTFMDDHRYQKLSQIEQKFIRHIPNGGYFGDAPRASLPERLKKIYDDPIKYKSPRLFPKADPNRPSQTVPASTSPSIGGVIAPDLDYSGGNGVPVDTFLNTENGIYTAPNESRRFTPREIARLQTFPDDFLFTGASSTKTKMIGNAVPVKLAEVYATEIMSQLFE